MPPQAGAVLVEGESSRNMRAKCWSFSSSLFFCLAATHDRVFCPSTAALSASSSSSSIVAFGIVPSVPRPPAGDSSTSSSRTPSNEPEGDDDALVRRLRANAVGIWSLQVRSGGATESPPMIPGAAFGGGGTEDPWSEEGTRTDGRRGRGSRNGGEPNAAAPTSDETTVLLNIRDDGSFRQCNEGYAEGRWMEGRWSIVAVGEPTTKETKNGSTSQSHADQFGAPRFYLALDRQYYGPPVDTLYDGSFLPPEVEDGTANHSPMLAAAMHVTGRIRAGKFALSKRDPAFFDRALAGTVLVIEPRASSEADSSECDAATFVLTQLVSGRPLAEKAQPATASQTDWFNDDRNAFQFRAMPPAPNCHPPRYAT
jgi:hypothetical protein